MKNSQKGIAPVIIVLIVAIILGGGYFVVKQQANKNLIVKDETANWKTYRDVNTKFEFKAPEKLKMGNVGPGGGMVFETNDQTYSVIVFCGYPNPDSTLSELRKEPGITSVDVYPTRISEGILTDTIGYTYKYLAKVFFTPQGMCDISMLLKNSSDSKVLRGTFDNILSTFKFTK